MSDYQKTYDGAAKDAANSTIAGSDFDTEFDSIEVMSTTKSNKVISGTAGNLIELDSSGDLSDSDKATPEGDVVGTTDEQTLTNKTISGATIDDDITANSETVTPENLGYLSGTTSNIQGQLDELGSVYYISVSSTATIIHAPSGWSVSSVIDGVYVLTHAIGHTDYMIFAYIEEFTSSTVRDIRVQFKDETSIIIWVAIDDTLTPNDFNLIVHDYS